MKHQNFIRFSLLIIVLVFFGCNSEFENIGSTEAGHINSENTPHTSDCNSQSVEFKCDNDYSQIEVCIKCKVCEERSILKNTKFVQLTFESLPYRDGRSSGYYEMDSNFTVNASLCIEKIPNQKSQIIGMNLVEDDSTFMSSFIAFDNIILEENGIVRYNKTINEADIFFDCQTDPIVILDRDPFQIDTKEETLSYFACIIGGYGDCYQGSFDLKNDKPGDFKNDQKELFKDSHRAFKNSTPCSGIFVKFE